MGEWVYLWMGGWIPTAFLSFDTAPAAGSTLHISAFPWMDGWMDGGREGGTAGWNNGWVGRWVGGKIFLFGSPRPLSPLTPRQPLGARFTSQPFLGWVGGWMDG